ncbi:MAG: SgcJ/EcaC family oxidoreductase [Segetibacter sp.]
MVSTSTTKLTTNISDEEAIQKVLNDFAEGWNAHDVKLFSKAFVEDADFTNVMGVSRSGRTAIEELHEPLFKTIWAFSTLIITNSKFRFIKTDVAAVDAWWNLDGLKTADGIDGPARAGLLNFVMTKHGNDWVITVMHNIDLPGSQLQRC